MALAETQASDVCMRKFGNDADSQQRTGDGSQTHLLWLWEVRWRFRRIWRPGMARGRARPPARARRLRVSTSTKTAGGAGV